LAVVDVLVALANGRRLEWGEIRAGVGLGEALRPPDVDVGRGREEALLELLAAEGGDDRTDHRDVEGQRLGDAGQLHLLEPDVALDGGPVLSAPFDGPVRNRVAVLIEDALRGDDVILAQLLAGGDLEPKLLGDLLAVELTHLLREFALFSIQ